MKHALRLLPFLLIVSGCAPAAVELTPRLVTIYSTLAAEPWLSEAYVCAAESGIVLARVPDLDSAEMIIRVGEPAALSHPSFQIDTEEILIAAHRQSPVQNLTLEEARALFAGQADPSVQVWVFSSGDDVQQAFDRAVMNGRPLSTFARLAVSPQQMSDALNADADAVGVLPRHWKAGDVREVFSAGNVPVLAITKAEPEGSLQTLIACLQR